MTSYNTWCCPHGISWDSHCEKCFKKEVAAEEKRKLAEKKAEVARKIKEASWKTLTRDELIEAIRSNKRITKSKLLELLKRGGNNE